jgi:putative tryptophan/tyrosine transport system substrate-binding protein
MEGVCSDHVQAQNKHSHEAKGVRREGEMNKRKLGSFALSAVLFALGSSTEAQQPAKVPRIGYLTGATPAGQSARIEAFRQGLRDLGYVEGKNIVIEYRYAELKPDRLPALAAELVRLKVDVIVTGGGGNTRAAKEATNTIPIVMTHYTDPVANGFVASLARPGGNITGLSNFAPEIRGKQLELLKEIIPKLSRVAVLGTSATSPSNVQQLKEIELVAGAFKVKLQYLAVLSLQDIETAFQAAGKGRADAVLVLPGSIFNSHRTEIAKLAVKSRLPAIYNHSEYVVDGGLMTYSASLPDLDRRAATYVGQDSERR